MRRPTTIVLAAAAGAAVLTGAAACGSDNTSSTTAGDTSAATTATATASTTAPAATTTTAAADKEGPVVTVRMASPKEFSFSLAPRSVKAGHVTFTATNGGTMTHEMVVLKTAMPAAKLPMESATKAREIGHVGEIGDLPAGSTKTIILTLKPGHYTVLCNLPGHYRGGMQADLTVTR